MENPYDVESRSELAYHNVWNEGDTNGYARGKAERAEIVSELVEALELTLWIIDGGKVYIGKPGTWQLPGSPRQTDLCLLKWYPPPSW